jgi:hypothetical protein
MYVLLMFSSIIIYSSYKAQHPSRMVTGMLVKTSDMHFIIYLSCKAHPPPHRPVYVYRHPKLSIYSS